LLVPMRSWDGELWNLQHIQPDGSKRYGRGRAAGLVHVMGDTTSDMTVVVEGYATARSALLCGVADAVVVAFSAGQLKPATLAAARRYPHASLWVLADNDQATPGNPGLTAAKEAAKAAGCCGMLVPEDDDGKSVDFNDLWVAHGRRADEFLTEVMR
jgi:putative DNA primase/helicase